MVAGQMGHTLTWHEAEVHTLSRHMGLGSELGRQNPKAKTPSEDQVDHTFGWQITVLKFNTGIVFRIAPRTGKTAPKRLRTTVLDASAEAATIL